MATRTAVTQSTHDDVVRATGQVYRLSGRRVWLNPDGEKNKEWSGFFIDVIAMAPTIPDKAWVVEIETDDSVCASEAGSQWVRYGTAFTSWCLVVPKGREEAAEQLLHEHNVRNCRIASWEKDAAGQYTFRGLPGFGNSRSLPDPTLRQPQKPHSLFSTPDSRPGVLCGSLPELGRAGAYHYIWEPAYE
jgi:hypothetical protein